MSRAASSRYESLGDAYHRGRLLAGLVAASGSTIAGLVWSLPEPLIIAVLGVVLAAHGSWRRRRPGGTALDSVLLDSTVMLVAVGTLEAPSGVLVVGFLYWAVRVVLFLQGRRAAGAVAYAAGGGLVVSWWFGPEAGDGVMYTVAASMALVACLPLVGWLFGQVGESFRSAKVLRKELDLARSRFEELFHGSTVPMFRTDPAHRLLDGNDALLELFGADHWDSLVAERVDQRYVDVGERDRLLEALMTHGRVQGFEVRLRRLDGTEFWGRISATLARRSDTPVLEGIIEDVTDRKQAEEQARLAETVFEHIGAAVVVSDRDGRIVHWNCAAEELVGYTGEEMLGRPVREAIVPDREAKVEEAETGMAAHGRWRGEVRVVRSDGSTVPCLSTISRRISSDGAHQGTVTVLTDISELDDARRRLSFQAHLLSQVHNAVIATDPDGVVIYWNDAAERLYGWTRDEALGKGIMDLNIPPGKEATAQAIMESVSAHGAWQGEFETRRRDGSAFPAWVTNTLIRDESGAPIGVVGVSSDLTDRKRAEEQARRHGDLARSVLESVHIPIAVVGEEGDVLAVNASWSTFATAYGPPWESIAPGASVGQLPAISNGAGAPSVPMRHLQAVMAGETSYSAFESTCELAGEERWFRTELTAVPGIGVIAIHRDVTDERLATAALEDLIRSKDQFIASASHELRTPLSVVVGLSQELLDGSFDPVQEQDLRTLLADQALEVSYLVEDLLVAARADAGTLTIREEPVDVNAELDKVITPYLHTGHEISSSIEDSLEMMGDPLRFRQIIRNLLSNAFRHGEPPAVLTARATSRGIEVSVSDHGPGVPPDAVDRLFVPYFTFAHNRGQPDSLGLGLYVSQRLCASMGWELTYTHEDTHPTFTLAAPVARAASTPITPTDTVASEAIGQTSRLAAG